MQRFAEGDRGRIDIPDTSDVEYEQFHGENGTMVSVLRDDTGAVTGNEQDSQIYRVNFDSC